MSTVHLFISRSRFDSFAEIREFIEEKYTEDGDALPSVFMEEAGLRGYEPAFIEAAYSREALPISQLLEKMSYATAWLDAVPVGLAADSAICVFSPNVFATPERSSLEYVGAFEYNER
ncbi:immunity 22 family protein [Ralstonia solanacearum]|uniref:Immunity 22 family protein n=1 Tax=Ralstonia solanacearum TaxID=305 RepID=A0AAE3T3M7_RALSL|nr:immunity 22 family protein [Ralstonia solanacearum]MDB0520963.1 immunity 22 family protein [Ralstonia solanacearum]